MTVSFRVGGRSVALRRPRVFVVGYSGRHPQEVARHIAELERMGVPRPAEVPAIWELPAHLVRQAGEVEVNGAATSGEAEPVLVFSREGVFVTVGSDHTDRDLEREDIAEAKLACGKAAGTECWALEEVRGRWDELHLSSEILVDGAWLPYQSDHLSTLLPVDWFLDRFSGDGEAVVFCGTVPAANGIRTDARAFRAALTDERGRLVCEYAIRTDG